MTSNSTIDHSGFTSCIFKTTLVTTPATHVISFLIVQISYANIDIFLYLQCTLSITPIATIHSRQVICLHLICLHRFL